MTQSFTIDELEVGVYTVSQAAKRLGVSPRTLERWVQAGESPVSPLSTPGRTRFAIAVVERFLNGEQVA